MGPIRVPMVSVRVLMLPLLSLGRVSAAGPGHSACLVRASRHAVNGGTTLTLPVGRRNRRLLASSRVPGGIAVADITRRRTAELLRVCIALLALLAGPAAAAEQSAEP